MKEHFINELDNFIMGWYIDTDLCDSMIDYYKNYENKRQSPVGFDHNIDKSRKNCIDCPLLDEKLFTTYHNNLQNCVNLYIKKYQFCNNILEWRTVETANIQHYTPPDGGYHAWHCERERGTAPGGKRVIVFMTYLNDVDDAGETEFYYQKVKIKAEKGLTLLWPSDWMFTHRGIASPSQEKYIYTGWFSFID